MKIGIDLGNKTFTVMRVESDGVEPVPNLSPDSYGQTQEWYPAIFSFNNDEWTVCADRDEYSITNLNNVSSITSTLDVDSQTTITAHDALVGVLSFLRQTIESNHAGKGIEQVVFSVPQYHPEMKQLFWGAMREAGWPIDGTEQALDETIAALFGSGLYDQVEELIGTSRTILVLDGRTNELCAAVYTVTVIQKENGGIHLDLYQLSGQNISDLGGYQLEQMMAARLKQIAAEQGGVDVNAYDEHEWFNLVDYIKDQFLIDPTPYIAYDFQFSDGTPWEQPHTIDSDEVYAVFRSEPYVDENGALTVRNIEQELHDFIFKLCDEGGITSEQIEEIAMAGGTFRLPFWRQTVQYVLPNANVVSPPDGLSEVALVGRGCAQLLQWQDKYNLTYSEKQKSGNYIGLGYFQEQEEKFIPLVMIGKGQAEKSGMNLLEIPTDELLVLHIYRGPQTEQLDLCQQVTTLRFLHTTLQQQLDTNHLGFRLTVNAANELFYELQHPYSGEMIEKGAIVL